MTKQKGKEYEIKWKVGGKAKGQTIKLRYIEFNNSWTELRKKDSY